MAKVFGQKSRYLILGDIKWSIVAFLCIMAIFFGALLMSKIRFTSFVGIFIVLLFFLFLRKMFDKYDKRSDQFFRGRWGEYDVLDELKKLPNDYSVFQDVNFPEERGNIDFVILGPTGIFAIEVKGHKGFIDYYNGELTRNNRIFQEKNILKQAKAGAFKLHDYIKSKTDRDFFVYPALVFSSSRAKMRFGLNPVNNVFVVQKAFLLPLITQQPPRFDSQTISALEENLKPLVKS